MEQYSPRYRYRVPKGNKSVGYFFGFMESIKQGLDIDEYSASQTTLEQIFNGFARLAEVGGLQREFTKGAGGLKSITGSLIAGDIYSDSKCKLFTT